ncbi:MAG: DUF695 domain-containing protein [Planctomycetota bacterium]
MRPNFEYYMASLDQWPFEVGVDLTARDRAPVAGKPFRVHLRLELNHASDDGLSTKEEDALLALIEDEILATLDPDGYELVASVTHRKARTLVLYSSRRPEDDPAIARALEKIETHTTKVMCEEDPGWDEYAEQLYPDTEMMHQIQDRRVLREFERCGDDAAEMHVIEPRFIGLDEAGAKALSESLSNLRYEIREMRRGAGDEWIVTAAVKSPLGLAVLDEFRHTWLELARQTKGAYQGWSAEVVPVSGKNNNPGLGGHLNDVPDTLDLPPAIARDLEEADRAPARRRDAR